MAKPNPFRGAVTAEHADGTTETVPPPPMDGQDTAGPITPDQPWANAPPELAKAPGIHQPTPIPPLMRPAAINGAGKLATVPFGIASLLANNKALRAAAKDHQADLGEALVALGEAFGWFRDDLIDERLWATLAFMATIQGVVEDGLSRPVEPYRKPPTPPPAGQPPEASDG